MSAPKTPAEEVARKDCVSAAEAMKRLDVRQQTLYAYVSRGWIRSIPQPGRKDRLYLREDIERLVVRSRARSGHGAVAAAAMNLGEPIIPTSITEITPDGPRYRGRLSADLVRMGTPFEAVAELLWTGLWHEDVEWPLMKHAPELRRLTSSLTELDASDQLLEVFALVTLHLGVGRGTVSERIRNGRTLDAARQIMQTMVGCSGLASPHGRYVPMEPGQSIAQGVMRSLAVDATAENHQAVQAILTLLADHELSPGTFSARVAASGGCTLHSCIASALSASSGLEVGRLYARVDEFLKGAATKGALMQKARELQERGAVPPGFVHPLYPHGDPRAKVLLEIARKRGERSRRLAAILGFVDEMQERFNLLPRHELAVVALVREMGAGQSAPSVLFALARTAGWVAHVQEQRLAGSLLRPRAKFTGMPPAGTAHGDVDAP